METAPSNRVETTLSSWRVGNRFVFWVASIMLVAGLSGTVWRVVTQYQTPGPFTFERQGLCDFHNGIYFPTRAVLRGQSPYGRAYAAENPVARQIPFFSPVILLLHAPLVVIPLRMGETLNFLLQLSTLAAIAYIVADQAGQRRRLDVLITLMACMALTRGGHVTLFTGYFTLQMILATFLAIVWADQHPWRSAWMLLIVSAKPTYILPLGFLMLARGNLRALAFGAALSITGAALSLGWLAYHEGFGEIANGLAVLAQQISETQEVHRGMDDESPVNSWTRLDLFAVICKWLGKNPGDVAHLAVMLVMQAFPMWILFQRRRRRIDDGLIGLTGAVILSTLLVSLYHQSYDALLLIAPVVGAIACNGGTISTAKNRQGDSSGWGDVNQIARWLATVAMVFPSVNYLSTRTFLTRFDPSAVTVDVLTSLNRVSLTIALILVCYVALPSHNDTQQVNDQDALPTGIELNT